ncbi:MAG TPA: radical SAM protein [Clostridia bacterium]|nr:radical SAM protein [Clostridia bacterium]
MYGSDAIHYPQDEMNTVLVPVTTGCIYNRCLFCSMYKDEDYFEIPFADIEMQLMNTDVYTDKIFLVGADPISIGFDKMKRLLEMVHLHLPYCARVGSYAAIRSIFKYSVEELSILHDAGLRLLYIGFETGRDDVLKLMNKGHTVEQAIQQAKKLNEANLPFNTIIMYGLAGEGESVNNGIATAKMVNQFRTEKFITMNLIVMEGSRLKEMVENNIYVPSSRLERLIEIRTFLENLEPEQPMLFDTTHPTNLVRMFGTLPAERRRLLREINGYIKALDNQ